MASSLLPADMHVMERGWLSSNNIVCLGDAPAVIDTGHTKHAAQTVTLLAKVLGDQPLATIAHTHLHSDHCGGTAALQAAWPDASTWVPVESLLYVQTWNKDALTFDGTGQRCDPFTASDALIPGNTVRFGNHHWEIHAAPGHDALAILLFEPEHGLLISGDAMWESSVGVIFQHIDGSGGFDTFTDTLALIERLSPRVVIPGHGAPFSRDSGAIDAAFASARKRIEYYKDHPAQHALHAAKVMIKYQMMDFESVPHAGFEAWLNAMPLLPVLHKQHRPDVGFGEWLDLIVEPLFSKGMLRRNETHVMNGD
ncbi:MBL fold metallo-hydrolase [Ottowia thiooxydans]|uniref:MBL fold metallo-hydrolase n=1 Tax=Ottowia thiooxydans TaxID=219182 RepID=UPI000418F163|nr:MBL fold metallo-hydrolase [Ottowia thiooxydans]